MAMHYENAPSSVFLLQNSSGDLYLGKRLFDIVLSFSLLIILSPVMLLTAFMVRLTSPGPVFFLQRRYGLNKTIFKIYKFRSIDKKGDYTPIGKFIRCYALDELPQLLNVLKGEMSLVGPRPHMVSVAKRAESKYPDYQQRYSMKPGIAGLSQMKGYSERRGTETQMISEDSQYKARAGILYDLWIIFCTSKVFFVGH